MRRFEMNTLKAKGRQWMVMLATACALAGCTNDEDPVIPIDKSYTDPQQDLEAFRARMLAAENGWEATLNPQPGKMFRLFLDLNPQGKVQMYADIDTTTAKLPTETPYRIETTQKINPTLVFEANSNLDRIRMSGAQRNVDKSYTYRSGKGDTLLLQGSQYGDELMLVKASKETRDRYKANILKNSLKSVSAYLSTVRYFYIQPEADKLIQFMMNPISRNMYITYLDQGVKFFGSDYAYALDGIQLHAPLNISGYAAQRIFWDAGTKELYTFYNGARLALKTSPIPVIPLHYLLGNEYPPGAVVVSSYLEKLPGWSVKFQDLWLVDDDAVSDQDLSLYYIIIDLHLPTNTMDLFVYYVRDNLMVRGKFPYALSKTADGIFDFTPLPIDDSDEDAADARAIDGKMPNIFGVMNNHHFRIEFFDAYEELGGVLPQYISVEDPAIYFTGYFLQ